MLFSRALIFAIPFPFKKKALHRITDERLCSTKASLLSLVQMSNRYASINRRKIPVISSKFV